MMMLHGFVKWFNEEKGFGFISSDNKEYFVHYKEIQREGFKTLKEQDKVTFEPANGPKGPLAKTVQIID